MSLLSKYLKPMYTEAKGKSKPDFQLDIVAAQLAINMIEEMSKVAQEVGYDEIHHSLKALIHNISNDYVKYFKDFT